MNFRDGSPFSPGPEGAQALEYPRDWTYTLFGRDRETLLGAVREILAGQPFQCEDSKTSRSGKYLSIHIHTRVESEDLRNAWFVALRSHEAVVMVL